MKTHSSAKRRRVVVDARMVGEVPHGFSRYVSAMARGLRRLADDGGLEYDVIFLVAPSWVSSNFYGFEISPTKAAFLSPAELVALPIKLRRMRADLYHSPTFSSLVPLSMACPWIATVHDLNHLKYGSAAQRLYYRGLLRPFARKAGRLLTVSRFSADELAPWAGVSLDRIGVVPNALDETWAQAPSTAQIGEVLSRLGLRARNYFFCLSNPKPHKNVRRLLAGYARYRGAVNSDPLWPLLLNLTPEQVAALSGKSGVPDGVCAVGPLRDDDVRALYAAAGAVAFPSRYEGFGLPPVEAAMAGAPIIVSRIPPHEESLAGLSHGEVAWAHPNRTEDWARCLSRAVRGELAAPSAESRARLLELFSVARLGTEMDRIYRAVLGVSV